MNPKMKLLPQALRNGSLTTNQISAQSVQHFQRCWKGGTSAGVQAHTCRCTPPMTCVICISVRCLNTHQICWLSAYPFLSYGLPANFTPPHFARATYQCLHKWVGVGSIHGRRDVATNQRWLFVNQPLGCKGISSSKASRGRVGQCHAGPLVLRFFH